MDADQNRVLAQKKVVPRRYLAAAEKMLTRP